MKETCEFVDDYEQVFTLPQVVQIFLGSYMCLKRVFFRSSVYGQNSSRTKNLKANLKAS